MTTTPTPQTVERVQAAIVKVLDWDAHRLFGAYYCPEARIYATADRVLFAGRYCAELPSNDARAFTAGDLAGSRC